MKAKKMLPTLFLILALAAGLGLLAYPAFSDWWNTSRQTKAIAGYTSAVEGVSARQKEEMLEVARQFNETISARDTLTVLPETERAAYESLLDCDGTGIMGTVRIPAIGVNLPIYHGTDAAALQVALGHLEWTSLPVGGPGTHTVISGHRGLPSARLFTDLDRLKEGDVFTLTVLDQTLTYQVDQIRTVEPTDLSQLTMIPGEDLCTLVTCTPYGVNSHRLLVRGHRVEGAATVILPDAARISPLTALPAVAAPLLALILLGLFLAGRLRPERLGKEQLAETLAQLRTEEPRVK